MALNPLFLNQCFDKNRLKNLITWSLLTVGEKRTIETVENLKALGFQFATQAGVSLGVDDLKIPPEKLSLVSQASQQVEATQQAYRRGDLTAIEKLQQLVDTWHRTSETLKQTVVNNFQSTDKLSPVYMMAFSGARGNISQVRQLAGMRGLMADPQGQIIGFPIRSNFREGLTLTEYMISCYGARKGLVDTALRTADAGYLTRRLIDVSQHMIVKAATCATPRGIVLKDLQSATKVILPLRERLIGRVLAEDVVEFPSITDRSDSRSPSTRTGSQAASPSLGTQGGGQPSLGKARGFYGHPRPKAPKGRQGSPSGGSSRGQLLRIGNQDILSETSSYLRQSRLVASRNQEISGPLASRIAFCRDSVAVRSPLTCSVRHGVCQLCYGWSLSEGRLVTLGEAVGIIAAQSIGEPGTQLTMRTFHTGGVFSGDVMAEIRAPHDGVVDFPQPLQGLLIRTSHGRIAFLTKAPGVLLLRDDRSLVVGGLPGILGEGPAPPSMAGVAPHGGPFPQGQRTPRPFAERVRQSLPALEGEGTRFSLESLTVLFVRQHEKVVRTQLLAEFSSMGTDINETIEAKRTLFSEMVGQVSFANVSVGTRLRESGDILQVSRNLGFIWILSGRRSPIAPLLTVYGKGSHLVNQESLVARAASKEESDGNTPLSLYNSNSIHSRSRGIVYDPDRRVISKSETYQTDLAKRDQNRTDQHRGLLEKFSMVAPTSMGDYSDALSITRFRFLPNRRYWAIFSSPGRKNKMKVLSSQPNVSFSPDCLLFRSFDAGKTLQNYQQQEQFLSAAVLSQNSPLLPFKGDPGFWEGEPKTTRSALGAPSSSKIPPRGSPRGGPLAPFGRLGPGMAHEPLGREDQGETSASNPDFYWFPGEQRSGEKGLAWVDSRYIAKRFTHGEIIWINEQNHGYHRTRASQPCSLPLKRSWYNAREFRKEELVGNQRPYFVNIGPGWIEQPKKDTTILGILEGRIRGVSRRPIMNRQHSSGTESTNPLASLCTWGHPSDTRLEREFQRWGSWATRSAKRQGWGTAPPREPSSGTPNPKAMPGGGLCPPLGGPVRPGHRGGKSLEKTYKKGTAEVSITNSTPPFGLTLEASHKFSVPTNELNKGRNQRWEGGANFKEERLHALNLKTRPGWVYWAHDQANLITIHESTQFCSESGFDNLCFEPSLAYFEAFNNREFSYSIADNLLITSLKLQLLELGVIKEAINGRRPLDDLALQAMHGLWGLEGRGPHAKQFSISKGGGVHPEEMNSNPQGSPSGGLTTPIPTNPDKETTPLITTRGSLFYQLATQTLGAEAPMRSNPPMAGGGPRTPEARGGGSFFSTNKWTSHQFVCKSNQVSGQSVQPRLKVRLRSRPLGQQVLLLLRKMLWLSQNFTPPLANVDAAVGSLGAPGGGPARALQAMQPVQRNAEPLGGLGGPMQSNATKSQALEDFHVPLDRFSRSRNPSILQTLSRIRIGWRGQTPSYPSNSRANAYQLQFLKNLVNRKPFLWLRGFPVQIQVVTNHKTRHSAINPLSYNEHDQGFVGLGGRGPHVEQPRPSRGSNDCTHDSPRLSAMARIQSIKVPERRLEESKVSQRFAVSLNGEVNTRSIRTLIEATPAIEKGLILPSPIRSEFLLPYGFSFGLAGRGLPASLQLGPFKPYIGTGIALFGQNAEPVQRNDESVQRNAEPLGGLGGLGSLSKSWATTWLRARRIVQAIESSTSRGKALPLQHSLSCMPQSRRRWFFGPALEKPSLLVLIRKGSPYPLSILENSKALFFRRYKFAKISINKRSNGLPLHLLSGTSFTFSTKQASTTLIWDTPSIGCSVAPVVPFKSFQTAFLPNPLYWIRFVGYLSLPPRRSGLTGDPGGSWGWGVALHGCGAPAPKGPKGRLGSPSGGSSPYRALHGNATPTTPGPRRPLGAKGLPLGDHRGVAPHGGPYPQDPAPSRRIAERVAIKPVQQNAGSIQPKAEPVQRNAEPLGGLEILLNGLPLYRAGSAFRWTDWPRGSKAGKKGWLSPLRQGIVPLLSPSVGELVSQRNSHPFSETSNPFSETPNPCEAWEATGKRPAGGGTDENLQGQTKGQPVQRNAEPVQRNAEPLGGLGGLANRTGRNVLFTQADYASFVSERDNPFSETTNPSSGTPNPWEACEAKSCIGEFVSIGDEIVAGYATPTSGQIVALEENKITLRRTQALLFYAQGIMHVNHDEWVEKNAPILTLTYQKLVTGDIVQGIPKIEQFFEAPVTKEGEPLSNSLQLRLRRSFQKLKGLYPIPLAVKKSLEEIQQILVEGILKVYLSQGVRIADKHLEIVIRQMISKGQVLDVGDTGLFQGEHVRLDRIERINLATYGEKADYEPAVLGITQASLDSESFISAASFQETTRVLSRDTIVGKTDFLRGLKERVVLGDLIQAGTGVDDNINYGLLFGIAPTYQGAVSSLL